VQNNQFRFFLMVYHYQWYHFPRFRFHELPIRLFPPTTVDGYSL
jgi:hypothetical protein